MLCHTLWICDPRPIGLGEWISIHSLLVNTSHRVVLHTNQEPSDSPYCPYKITHERFRINKREFQMTRFGVRLRAANVSDIERIAILFESGGCYFDLDIWHQKEFDASGTKTITTFYENPAYKTIANAVIIAKTANWLPFRELLELFDHRILYMRSKGWEDLREEPPVGLSKHHTLFWKLTGDFLKGFPNDVSVCGKAHYYQNGWRRIGRHIRDAGIPLNPAVDPASLGMVTRGDRIHFIGADGFHFYNALFSAEQVLQIPEVAAEFARFRPQ